MTVVGGVGGGGGGGCLRSQSSSSSGGGEGSCVGAGGGGVGLYSGLYGGVGRMRGAGVGSCPQASCGERPTRRSWIRISGTIFCEVAGGGSVAVLAVVLRAIRRAMIHSLT